MRTYRPGDRLTLAELAEVVAALRDRVQGKLRLVGGDLTLFIKPDISTEMGRAPERELEGAPADPTRTAAQQSTPNTERTQP